MSSYNHFGCSRCEGSFNGGNCPGCSSVGSGNEFVYDLNLYSYNKTLNFFNQPPQHQFKTYSCDSCGGDRHYGFDCQTRAPLVYEQDPCNNQNLSYDQPPYYSSSLPQQYPCCEYCGGPHDSYDFQSNNQVFDEPYSYSDFDSFGFDQPPQYPIDQSPLHDDMSLHKMLIRSTAYLEESTKRQKQSFDEFKISYDSFWSEIERNKVININAQITWPSVDYFDDEDDDDTMVTIILPPVIALPLPLLTTMKPADTLLMGDKNFSTTHARETDQFIKSGADDFVLIPRESEETSDDDYECNMLDISLSTTDVREDDFVTFSNPLFDTSCYDNPLFDREFEDISILDPIELTLIIDEPPLLIIPPLAYKQFSLREVDIFYPFFLPDTVGWNNEGDGNPFLSFLSYAITSSCCILTEGGDVSLLPSSPHIG
nr:hypothetical protein [Tanacetum cinerariifolium]